MPSSAEQFTQAVIKSIPAFFTDALDQLEVGEGAYIATGEPQGIVAQTGQAVARAYCRAYAATDPQLPGDRNQRTELACRPYLDSLSPGKGEAFVIPFEGGQCAGLTYRAAFRRTFSSGSVSTEPDRFFIGPGNVRARVNSVGPDGQTTSFVYELFSTRTWLVGAQAPPAGSPRWIFLGTETNPPGDSVQVTLVDVRRVDGLADSCGNPPPAIQPQTKIPDPIGNPFQFAPSPKLNIPISVVINPDGSVTFDVGTGPVNVELFPDGPGDGGGGSGGDPGDPTDPGAPGSPSDTGEGGDSDGEAPEGEELVGLKVEVIAAPPLAPTTGRVTQTVYRGIGYIRMGYEGRLGVDVSGGVAFPTQFYHAQQRGLSHWAVSANIGFNLRVTPYYRSIEE